MKTILCFGDSITFGKTDRQNCWVSLLRKKFEDNHNYVYNLGIPGNTSFDLVERFEIESKARCFIKRKGDKHLILVSIGTNDARYNDEEITTSNNNYRKNIQKIIKISKKLKKTDLIFIAITYLDESKTIPWEDYNYENKYLEGYNQIMKEECRKNNLTFIDISNVKISTEDGLHPDIKQHKEMYKIINKNVSS
tara:strand:+ start:572 stop:1153 length:582 start_codon:yes stop_codon:yes gene_type:complete